MNQKQIKEAEDLIKQYYPDHTAKIEKIELIGDVLLLKGNGGKGVIYRIVDGELELYKKVEGGGIRTTEVNKWKSIIRGIKSIVLTS